MATQKSGYVYEVVTRGVDLRSGLILENILHLRQKDQTPPPIFGTEIAGSDLNQLALTFRNAYGLAILPGVSEHYRMEDVTVKQIIGYEPGVGGDKVVYGEQGISLAGGPFDQGSVLGEATPQAVAMSVAKKSSKAGKSFRGSMRIGIIAEDSQSNGALTDAAVGTAQTRMNTFRTSTFNNGAPSPAGDNTLLIFSRTLFFNAVLPLAESETYSAVIIAFAVHQNLGSQNSRKVRSDQIINQAA